MNFNFIQDPRWNQLDVNQKSLMLNEAFNRQHGSQTQGFTEEEDLAARTLFMKKAADVENVIYGQPGRTVGGTIGDIGTSLLQGVVGTGQAIVGLGNIPTGGRFGKWVEEDLGLDLKQVSQDVASLYSDAQKYAQAKVEEAEGFGGTVKTMLQYPSTIGTSVGQSAVPMVAGGLVGRGLLAGASRFAPGLAARPAATYLAAGGGEGTVAGGALSENIRSQTEDGLMTPKQTALAVLGGGGVGAISGGGGLLAQKAGFLDPDVLATKLFMPKASRAPVAAGTKKAPGIVGRVGGGMLGEGFQELPQEMYEQAMENIALGRPAMEGTGKAGAQGFLAGALMGSAVNVINRKHHEDIGKADSVDKALESFTKAVNPIQSESTGFGEYLDQNEGVIVDEVQGEQWEQEILAQRERYRQQMEMLKRGPVQPEAEGFDDVTAQRESIRRQEQNIGQMSGEADEFGLFLDETQPVKASQRERQAQIEGIFSEPIPANEGQAKVDREIAEFKRIRKQEAEVEYLKQAMINKEVPQAERQAVTDRINQLEQSFEERKNRTRAGEIPILEAGQAEDPRIIKPKQERTWLEIRQAELVDRLGGKEDLLGKNYAPPVKEGEYGKKIRPEVIERDIELDKRLAGFGSRKERNSSGEIPILEAGQAEDPRIIKPKKELTWLEVKQNELAERLGGKDKLLGKDYKPQAKEGEYGKKLTERYSATTAIVDDQSLLDTMQSEVNDSSTKGYNYDEDGNKSWYSASSPEWMKNLNAAAKKSGLKGLSRAEINTVIDKARNGQPLTERQQSHYDLLLQAAEEVKQTDPSYAMAYEAEEMEADGFVPMGGQNIPAADLEMGSSFIGTVDGKKDTWHVKGEKDGNIVLQDGVRKEVDMFDRVNVDGIKAPSEPLKKGDAVSWTDKKGNEQVGDLVVKAGESWMIKKADGTTGRQTEEALSRTQGVTTLRSWFDLGKEVSSVYNDKTDRSTSLKPNKIILVNTAKKLGISLADAERALSVYHSGDPKSEEKLFKDKRTPSTTLATGANTPPTIEHTSFDEMVKDAAKWKGAAVKAEQLIDPSDTKTRLAHSKMTTKGDLDSYLMKKYGLNESEARDVSNELTRQNIPNDMTADLQDFKDEPWAPTTIATTPITLTQGNEGKFDPLAILTNPNKETQQEEDIPEQKESQTTREINSAIKTFQEEITDWSGREYKKNRKKVSVGGTNDDLNSGITSVDSANERRRQREIQDREQSIVELEKAKERIAQGEDETKVLGELLDSRYVPLSTFAQKKLDSMKTPTTAKVGGSEGKPLGDKKTHILGEDVFTGTASQVEQLFGKQPADDDLQGAIGRNPDGKRVYVDENGIRSYQDGNVRSNQPVSLTPTSGSIKTESDNAQILSKGVQHSTTTSTDKPAVTLPQIKKWFKGQAVGINPDGSTWVRLKNGAGLTIRNVEQVAEGKYLLSTESGKMDQNGLIAGKYANNKIELVDGVADGKTFTHELEHFLEDIGVITKMDQLAMDIRIRKMIREGNLPFKEKQDQRENRADFMAHYLSDREEFRGTTIGKIVQKVSDFLDAMLNLGRASVRKVARGIESGKIYEREAQGQDVAQTMFETAPNTSTRAFRDWFEGSMVTKDGGAGGEPLRVYHGGYSDTDQFQPRIKKDRATGRVTEKAALAFFSDNPDVANSYSLGIKDGRSTPVYLSLKNPLVVDFNGREWFGLNKHIEQAKSDGFDGVIAKNIIDPGNIKTGNSGKPSTTYIAFNPTQIKSVNNRGSWSQTDPRIQYSTQEAFHVDNDAGMVDNFKHHIVDELSSISKVYQAIGKEFSEETDFLLKERLRVSKAKSDIDKSEAKYFKPIKKIIGESGLTVEKVDEFLYARHAPEANARLRMTNARHYLNKLAKAQKGGKLEKSISAMDKEFDDMNAPTYEVQSAYQKLLESELAKATTEKELGVAKDWETFSAKPSGMTDVEATKLNNKWKSNNAMKAIAKIFDTMNNDSLDISLAAGRMTKEEHAAIKGTFKYYAPLHREGHETKRAFSGIGQGLTNLGRDTQVRGGSTKRAVHLLANAMVNHEKAIVNSKKAEVTKAFVEFVKANPNEDFWSFEKSKTRPVYDGAGNIRRQPARTVEAWEAEVKVDGQTYIISVNRHNDYAMRILEIIKGGQHTSGPIVGALMRLNRILSSVNTTFNPEFIISNFARDFQTAAYNLSDTEVKSMTGQVLKNVGKAMKGLHSFTRGDSSHEWAKVAKQFEESGAKIGWIDYGKDVESRTKKLESQIDLFREGHISKKSINKLFNTIEDYNSIVENGVRLASFKAGLDAGMTESKAAFMAKNLTVNFNQKGAMGPLINSLYLFANAGIQGSVRIVQALKNSPRARKMVGATIAAASVLAVANRGIGGDDEDGENYYEKVDEHLKARNLILMIPGSKGKYVKIPLPWGYNVFWALGTEIGEAFTSDKYNALEGMHRMINTTLDAFNPLQSATLLQTLSPTILDPIAMVGENKTFYGGPLMPETNIFDKTPMPDSQRFWKSVRPVSKFISQSVNAITGGDKVVPGLIDVSPETLDLVFDTFTGGAGRFVADTLFLPVSAVTGDLTLSKTPMLRKVLGTESEYQVANDYRKHTTYIYRLKERMEVYPEKAQKYRKDPAFKLYYAAKSFDKQIGKLRKSLKVTKNEGTEKLLEKRINKLQKTFNRRFIEAGV